MKSSFSLFSVLRLLILLISWQIPVTAIVAQPFTQPFHQDLRRETERKWLLSGKAYHPVWPVETAFQDTLTYAGVRTPGGRFSATLVGRKLFSEPLLRVDAAGFKLKADFVMDFQLGMDPGAERTSWTNTRGLRADGSIGSKFAFHTAFYENQAVFPSWLDTLVTNTWIVPGQGHVKLFGDHGFDYAFAEGHLAWAPSRYFTLKFGHGRNFIGEGYRSLLLSDASFSYPFLSLKTRVWNLEYINIFSQLQQVTPYPFKTARKYSSMHYLGWNILPWLNIGLFEAIVWPSSDENGKRGFEIGYLNPVIFLRPVEYSLGSSDNALLGGSLRVIIREKQVLYAQAMLDEFKLEHVLKGDGWWANKQALQLGLKIFDLAGVPNLYFQAEYNQVRPYTYSHKKPEQNYGHYAQPLAHPQGANFRELLVFASHRVNRWMFDYQMVYTVYGADTAGMNFGRDIFMSYSTHANEFGNTIAQGLKTRLMIHNFRAGWLVNPATNLRLSAGLTLRSTSSDPDTSGHSLIWVGLRSALFNRYYDW